ncbi:MAG: hypothetical protein ABI758_02350 [Candidatus Woesebacteria bacterium]
MAQEVSVSPEVKQTPENDLDQISSAEFTKLLQIEPSAINRLVVETVPNLRGEALKSLQERASAVVQALDHVLRVEDVVKGREGQKSLNKNITDICLKILERYLTNYARKDARLSQSEFSERRYARLRVEDEAFPITSQLERLRGWDQRLDILLSSFEEKNIFSQPKVQDAFKRQGGIIFNTFDHLEPYATSDDMVAVESGYYDLRLQSQELKKFLSSFANDYAGMVTGVILTDLLARREKAVGRALSTLCTAEIDRESDPFINSQTLEKLKPLGVLQSTENREKFSIFKQSSPVHIPAETMTISVRDQYSLEQTFTIKMPHESQMEDFYAQGEYGFRAAFANIYDQVSQTLRNTPVTEIKAQDIEQAFAPKAEARSLFGFGKVLRKITSLRRERSSESSPLQSPDVAIVINSGEESMDDMILPGQLGNRNPSDPRSATSCVYTLDLNRENGAVENVSLHLHHPQTDGALAVSLFGKNGPIEKILPNLSNVVNTSTIVQMLRREKNVPGQQWDVRRREQAMGPKILAERRRTLQEHMPDIRKSFIAPSEWKAEIDDRLEEVNKKIEDYMREVFDVRISKKGPIKFVFNFDNFKSIVLAHAESTVGLYGNGFDWLITAQDGTFAPTLMGAITPQEARAYGDIDWKESAERGERLLNLGGLYTLDKTRPIQLLVLLGWVTDQAGLEGPLSTISDWLTDKGRAALLIAEKKGLISKVTGDEDIESFTTAMLRYYKNHLAVSTFKNKEGKNETRFRVDKKQAANLEAILAPSQSDSSLTNFQLIYERSLLDIEAFLRSDEMPKRIVRAKEKNAETKQRKSVARQAAIKEEAAKR